MKTFMQIMSVVLGLVSLYFFFQMETRENLYEWFIIFMSAVIFFAFSIVEERNEEISRLRKILMGRQDAIKNITDKF